MIAPPKPPAHHELEALIKEARERRRRRRLLVVAGVAIAAAVGLVVYALIPAGGPNRSANSAPVGPGGVPLCRSSQISLSFPMLIGPEEGRTGLFVMTNKNGSPCSLPLRPPRTSLTLHGVRLPVRQVGGRGIVLSGWEPLRATHLLKPGGKAAISSYWQNWCGSHSYRPMFAEHYRFDSQLVVSFPLGPHPFCSDRSGPSTIRVSRPLLVRG